MSTPSPTVGSEPPNFRRGWPSARTAPGGKLSCMMAAQLHFVARRPRRTDDRQMESHMHSRDVKIALLTAVMLAGMSPLMPAAFAQTPTVMATGLDNPRGLAFGPDGAIYVVEAGRGGTGTMCLPNPAAQPGTRCYGPTGADHPHRRARHAGARAHRPALAGRADRGRGHRPARHRLRLRPRLRHRGLRRGSSAAGAVQGRRDQLRVAADDHLHRADHRGGRLRGLRGREQPGRRPIGLERLRPRDPLQPRRHRRRRRQLAAADRPDPAALDARGLRKPHRCPARAAWA